LWEKICSQELQNNFLGKFGEIRAKIFRTPNNFLAPRPMCWDVNANTRNQDFVLAGFCGGETV